MHRSIGRPLPDLAGSGLLIPFFAILFYVPRRACN